MGTTNKMTLFVIVLLFIMGCLSCHDDNDNETLLPRSVNALTLDDVYNKKITTLVSQEILLYENITWLYFGLTGAAVINPPMLLFEETDRYLEPSEEVNVQGIIMIESPYMTLSYNKKGEGEYSYQGVKLDKKKHYYLLGSFEYATSPQQGAWNDPELTARANDFHNWHLIFKFRLTGLSETPPQ